jgi:putative oxidoreductase
MNVALSVLQHGIPAAAVGLTLNRVALGAFFTFSGYHKLFNSKRHAFLVETFHKLSIPFPSVMQWFVPSVEFLGGLSLVSGILAPFAALGLIAVCLVATCTAGLRRIPSYKPIDWADYADDVLYLPEVLYVIGLAVLVTAGPGYTLF